MFVSVPSCLFCLGVRRFRFFFQLFLYHSISLRRFLQFSFVRFVWFISFCFFVLLPLLKAFSFPYFIRFTSFIMFRNNSFCFVSFCFVSFQFIWCRFISLCFTSVHCVCHFILLHVTSFCFTPLICYVLYLHRLYVCPFRSLRADRPAVPQVAPSNGKSPIGAPPSVSSENEAGRQRAAGQHVRLLLKRVE